MEWKANLRYPECKVRLLETGYRVARQFCYLNSIPLPALISYSKSDWLYPRVHAWYRASEIHICIDACADITKPGVKNWSWPGYKVDRSPYGAILHELGHHVDDHYTNSATSPAKALFEASNPEEPITNYASTVQDYFAEVFRLYVSNCELLALYRPKAWQWLVSRFKSPTYGVEPLIAMGANVRPKVSQVVKKLQALPRHR